MLQNDLTNFLKKTLESAQQSNSTTKRLTVGIEQEFFLLDKQSKPVSHKASQAFLFELTQMMGWRLQETMDTPEGSILWRASRDRSDGRYLAVKYDHHPHLLEVALPYSDNLISLEEELRSTFKAISEAAASTGLFVHMTSVLDVAADHISVSSDLSYHQSLRYYRSKLFEKRGEKPDPLFVNYAAVIAATQTHIGGIPWLKDARLVESLYCFEPIVLGLTTPTELLKKRWSGYSAVFKGFPLVGFPAMDSWSIESWIDALLKSPLAGGPKEKWAAETAVSLKEIPGNSWSNFFKLVRDLQIIRPRLFGTLEFRADPAQNSIERILAVSALRLGLSEAVVSGHQSPLSYKMAGELWWKRVSGQVSSTDVNTKKILNLAYEALSTRGLGEEIYLDPLG